MQINVLFVTLTRCWADRADSSCRTPGTWCPHGPRIHCSGLCPIDSDGKTSCRFLRSSTDPLEKLDSSFTQTGAETEVYTSSGPCAEAQTIPRFPTARSP